MTGISGRRVFRCPPPQAAQFVRRATRPSVMKGFSWQLRETAGRIRGARHRYLLPRARTETLVSLYSNGQRSRRDRAGIVRER
jgi:hypothetical protein